MSEINYLDGIKKITDIMGTDVTRIYVYDFSVSGLHTGDGRKMEHYAFQVELKENADENKAEEKLSDIFADTPYFSAVLYSPFFEKDAKNKQRRITIWSQN